MWPGLSGAGQRPPPVLCGSRRGAGILNAMMPAATGPGRADDDERARPSTGGPCARAGAGLRPLSGMLVVDTSTYLAGPFASLMLADLGAEVIKVEPPRGDPFRRIGYRHPGADKEAPSVGFAAVNRDKRGVRLDLRTEDGRRRMLELLGRADAFVENWRPGVAARLGLDDATLERTNPRLLHVAITGWGPDGPWADRPAFDAVMQGVTSHAHAVGEGNEPRLIGTALADKVAGMMAAQAVLAGLLARERGQGAGRVDVSMLDACAYFAAPDMLETRMVVSEDYDAPPRLTFPSTLVRCADGHIVASPGSGAQVAAACRAVGHPEWVDRLRAQPTHAALGNELNRLLGTAAATMTTESLLGALTEHDVPCAPALDLDGQLAHPQVLHNGTYPEYSDQHFGTVRRARYPAVGQRWSVPETSRSSPTLGQHTPELAPPDGGGSAG